MNASDQAAKEKARIAASWAEHKLVMDGAFTRLKRPPSVAQDAPARRFIHTC